MHMHCEFFMNPIEDGFLSQTIPSLQPYAKLRQKKNEKNQGQPHQFLHLTTCCEEEEYHRPLPPTPLPPPPPDDAVIAEGSNMSCSEEYCRWWWPCDRICLIAAPLMFPRSDMRGERRRRQRQRAENDQAVWLNLFWREKDREERWLQIKIRVNDLFNILII